MLFLATGATAGSDFEWVGLVSHGGFRHAAITKGVTYPIAVLHPDSGLPWIPIRGTMIF